METICLKVITKHPQDRYPSCQAFADDLRRWQEGEPITARTLGNVERFRRWGQKNKAMARMICALIVALTLGIVASTFFAIRANILSRQAIAARKEAEESAQVADNQRTIAYQRAQQTEESLKEVAIAKGKVEDALKNAESARWATEKARIRIEEEKAKAQKATLESDLALAQLKEKTEYANVAEQEKLSAERKNEGYSLGRPQLYAHIQRLLEAKKIAYVNEALAGIPQKYRGWEWSHLNSSGKIRIGNDYKLPYSKLSIEISPALDGRYLYIDASGRLILSTYLGAENPKHINADGIVISNVGYIDEEHIAIISSAIIANGKIESSRTIATYGYRSNDKEFARYGEPITID